MRKSITTIMLAFCLLPVFGQTKDIIEKSGVTGGLIVHLGCDDADILTALRPNSAYRVQGLDNDPAKVAATRKQIQSKNLYGPVSAVLLQGNTLPYIDNLVNLIVVSKELGVPRAELERVLAPGGAIYRNGSVWEKPVPKEIDDWGHYLYDASNGNTSRDRVVAPPKGYQWRAGPLWTRNHDIASSFQTMVTSGGRIFYIMDMGSTHTLAAPSKWTLVCRDAYNGLLLWKRPLGEWMDSLYSFKAGPVVIMRRLVAVDDAVYVTLDINGRVSQLNAATGETVRTFADTENTQEMIVAGNNLIVSTGQDTKIHRKLFSDSTLAKRTVKSVDLKTGEIVWEHTTQLTPVTLCADSKKVCFHTGQEVVALAKSSGEKLWSVPLPIAKQPTGNFAPNLTIYKEMVYFSTGSKSKDHKAKPGAITAIDGSSGEVAWSSPHAPSNYRQMFSLHVFNDKVWFQSNAGASRSKHSDGRVVGLDYRTGEVVIAGKANTDPHEVMHPRCHLTKATANYLITGWIGAEFIEWESNKYHWHQWARGACTYGHLPANGLFYVPQNPCQCFLGAQIHGLNALSAANPLEGATPPSSRLMKGPGYQKQDFKTISNNRDKNWPTYRSDFARSGYYRDTLNGKLKKSWSVNLDKGVSQPVCVGNRVYIASAQTASVTCLSAADGGQLWRFIAGGPVDSPPTIWQGRALFGSTDGHVYCLDAATGEPIWRYLAAPVDRRLLAFGNIESVWPVHGSVLIHQGKVHAMVGRHRWLGGGLRYLILDAATGEKVSETLHTGIDPETKKDYQERVVMRLLPFSHNDILSCDEDHVYMGTEIYDFEGNIAAPQVRFHKPGDRQNLHLLAQNGLLDDSWYFRSYWTYASAANNRPNRAQCNFIGEIAPSGRILSIDENDVYGYGRRPGFFNYTIGNMLAIDYRLFRASKIPKIKVINPNAKYDVFKEFETEWSQNHPVFAFAMVVTKEKLITAGPIDPVDLGEKATWMYKPTPEHHKKMDAALNGKLGAKLIVTYKADGKPLQELEIDGLPVFDGMSAAGNNIFVALEDGTVVCFTGE